MAEQDERPARLGAHCVDDRRQVGEQVVAGGDPAALARALAVAALVVADDAPAVRVQVRRDVRVATDVLAQAVDDDNRSPGVGGRPVAAHQRHAVTGLNRPSHHSPPNAMIDRSEFFELSHDNGIAHLQLNRPERMNTMTLGVLPLPCATTPCVAPATRPRRAPW